MMFTNTTSILTNAKSSYREKESKEKAWFKICHISNFGYYHLSQKVVGFFF